MIRVRYTQSGDGAAGRVKFHTRLARAALEHFGINNGDRDRFDCRHSRRHRARLLELLPGRVVECLARSGPDQVTRSSWPKRRAISSWISWSKPIGKQDQYMAAFGGLTVLDIACDGKVNVTRILGLSVDVLEELEDNIAAVLHGSDVAMPPAFCGEQDSATRVNDTTVVSSLREIKDIGIEVCLRHIADGNLRRFGELMDLHWQMKKRLSKGITNPTIDAWYELAKANGAIGGKIYRRWRRRLPDAVLRGKKGATSRGLRKAGLRELNFRFDFEGSKVVFDVVSSDGRLAHIQRQVRGDQRVSPRALARSAVVGHAD